MDLSEKNEKDIKGEREKVLRLYYVVLINEMVFLTICFVHVLNIRQIQMYILTIEPKTKIK